MESISNEAPAELPRRGQLNQEIRSALRDMGAQLSLLTHRVSGHLDLRDIDLRCLDLIDSRGPLSAIALARLAGLHPATMTGVIDRLERGGWISRQRDPGDRRGVLLQSLDSRRGDVLRLTAGMNAELARICAGYSDTELHLIAGFLRQAADAGRAAAARLDAT